MIRIEGATFDTVNHIAKHLRENDRVELEAMAPAPELATVLLPSRVMSNASMAFVARHNDTPVSCWGLVPLWQTVGMAFAFGTDDWGLALLAMTKHVRRFMLPLLLDNGYHRIECRSLATRQDVGRWLEIFDAEAEAVLRGSGARGEDFILYRWLSDERRRATR
jgi:hypothetical protein